MDEEYYGDDGATEAEAYAIWDEQQAEDDMAAWEASNAAEAEAEADQPPEPRDNDKKGK
jgi:hypothetical protein